MPVTQADLAGRLWEHRRPASPDLAIGLVARQDSAHWEGVA